MAVVRPAQFVTQPVTNRECLVKQVHVANIRGIKALAELACQFSRARLSVQPWFKRARF